MTNPLQRAMSWAQGVGDAVMGRQSTKTISDVIRALESSGLGGSTGIALRIRSRYTLRLAQTLYERDGYAAQVVRNIVNFAVGEGVRVDFGDAKLNKLWHSWRWSLTSPLATERELQTFAATSLIRDGDIFLEELPAIEGTGYKLRPIDPAYIYKTVGPAFNGIILDDQMRPTGYLVDPIDRPLYLRGKQRQTRTIDRDDMIHVFEMEYSDQTRGLSLSLIHI